MRQTEGCTQELEDKAAPSDYNVRCRFANGWSIASFSDLDWAMKRVLFILGNNAADRPEELLLSCNGVTLLHYCEGGV